MSKAAFQLQAFMVDNDAAQRAATEARLVLVNERHLHLDRVQQAAPVSTYTWTLDDASIIGLPGIDVRDAAKVFAIALSAQSWRLLHSPVILSTVSILEVESDGPFGEVSTKLTFPSLALPPLTVDEVAFVEAAKGLATVWTMGGARGDILREAVNSYWDALHSVHRRSRYLSLWAALERTVNAYRKPVDGPKFDRRAARITRRSATRIKPLRKLNNWLKHAGSVSSEPPHVAENLGRDAGRLKELVDRSLASRFGFSLNASYRQ